MQKIGVIKLVASALILFVAIHESSAQLSELKGKIMDSDSNAIVGASLYISELKTGTTSAIGGEYDLTDLPSGTYTLNISFMGFTTRKETLKIEEGVTLTKNFYLYEDYLHLGAVVITGTRNQIAKYDAPVIVNTISNRTFEATQSLSIAEGLNFSPGLRLENNCQNCGFTQLRMNGLDGAYSQILINSRPVFSALAGVYGLEMLPANMVDRIEIVRGGGSVLYGGNAIAGTVNIITKDPINNAFEVGFNQSFTQFETPDRTLTINGSIVSEDVKKGITFFGFNRQREPWDANADGFSEITKLNNNTFGFDAFWKTSERSKLKFGLYQINEFRRGGNAFDLLPHQSDLTEQLQHQILSSNLSFEQYTKNLKHKFSAYSSAQWVKRGSYYGAGGRIITEGDSITEADVLALNAYGNSNDFSLVGGVQYNYEMNSKMMFTAGSEYIYNKVLDKMSGYRREIEQEVGTAGTYVQFEYKPRQRLTFLLGGRFDRVNIKGYYNLADEQFELQKPLQVLVPRLSALYQVSENLKIRTSFAQGYRGPQAFDEDLHLETVGGAARFIRLSEDLQTERSNSASLSLNYEKMMGKKQMNLVAEGFYTQLINPFILSDQQELANGVAVITKRNGSGATVSGINLEANLAFGRKFILQSGATLQTALYAETEEIWSPEDADDPIPATFTDRMLRTPNVYGFFSLVYNPIRKMSVSYSGVYTGSMAVAHVIDPETERTIIRNTPVFFENNIKLSYTLKTKDNYKLQLFGGVQNIFNSFQKDFDRGVERDGGYVYGPTRPRTVFLGLKFGLDG